MFLSGLCKQQPLNNAMDFIFINFFISFIFQKKELFDYQNIVMRLNHSLHYTILGDVASLDLDCLRLVREVGSHNHSLLCRLACEGIYYIGIASLVVASFMSLIC